MHPPPFIVGYESVTDTLNTLTGESQLKRMEPLYGTTSPFGNYCYYYYYHVMCTVDERTAI